MICSRVCSPVLRPGVLIYAWSMLKGVRGGTPEQTRSLRVLRQISCILPSAGLAWVMAILVVNLTVPSSGDNALASGWVASAFPLIFCPFDLYVMGRVSRDTASDEGSTVGSPLHSPKGKPLAVLVVAQCCADQEVQMNRVCSSAFHRDRLPALRNRRDISRRRIR